MTDVRPDQESLELFTLDGDEYIYVVDDPSGTPTPAKVAVRECLGPAYWARRNRDYNIHWCSTLGFLTRSQIGATATHQGTTEGAGAFGSSNVVTRRKRLNSTSAASAGSNAGWRMPNVHCYRGDAAGYGGFRFLTRFAMTTLPATWRAFIGLTSSTSALSNADPSTNTQIVGLGKDVGDTAWQIMSNDGTGSATKAALNSTDFPITANVLLEIELYCPPGNAQNVTYWVRNISGVDANGNDTYSKVVTGTISADLPATATTLAMQVWANNGSTASAIVIDCCKMFCETLGGAN